MFQICKRKEELSVFSKLIEKLETTDHVDRSPNKSDEVAVVCVLIE